MGANSSYLGSNCHLNETQPDLVFDTCERIEFTDLTTSCPVFDSNICKINQCFCDPTLLPSSYPCPEHLVCKWKVKNDPQPPSQILSENAKILIGFGCLAFVIFVIGVSICIYRWKRVCLEVRTSSNHTLYTTFHSNSDECTVHCISRNEINTENP